MWGRTPVSVAAVDVDRVTIRLARGLTMSGRVEFEAGAIAAPAAAVLQRGAVFITPVDNTLGFCQGFSTLGADGSFKTSGCPAGPYTISASLAASGWIFRSVTAAGRDLLAQPFELMDDINGVVVTCTDKAAELSGSMTAGAGAIEAFVVLLPIDPRASAQFTARRASVAAVGADGTYRLTGVLPGDYLVFAAAPSGGRAAFQDEQVLASLAKLGTRITLADREKRSLPLTVVRSR
jgi:hypothetical protein